MSTTLDELRSWFALGKEGPHRYMVVATDTFSYEDYPIFTDAPNAELARLRGKPMTKVMEVYDLSLPWVNTSELVWQLPSHDPWLNNFRAALAATEGVTE